MKPLSIRNKSLCVPLIQGGMGVGVSLGSLAGHVAKCGAMGVISTVLIGYQDDDFRRHPKESNIKKLREEIKKAQNISQGDGMLAINIMVAANQYEELVATAIDAGIDAIISGAGLPLKLAALTAGKDVAIAPIVSSAKAAALIMKSWLRHEERLPDFIVLEGPGAGGHLGFTTQQLTQQNYMGLLPQVKAAIQEVESKYQATIPLMVAGSVFDGYEMAAAMQAGADGVQIGSRFIATYECDASDNMKQIILNANEDDLTIVESPVGMPARAIRSPLIKTLEKIDRIPPEFCLNCLKTCQPATTKYCISQALIAAVTGDFDKGLFFAGQNLGRIDRMYHVAELIDEIKTQWEEAQ